MDNKPRRSLRLDQKRNPSGSSCSSPTKENCKRRKSGAGLNESLYDETSDKEESEEEEEPKVPTSK